MPPSCKSTELTVEIGEETARAAPHQIRHRRLTDLVIVCLLLTLQSGVLVYYAYRTYNNQFLKGNMGISLLEGRHLKGFPIPTLQRFLSGFFQEQFEKAASDNFPERGKMLDRYSEFQRRVNLFSLDFLGPRFSPFLPMGRDILRPRGQDRLLRAPAQYESRREAKVRDRASYYNSLAADLPGVNFYVFAALGPGDAGVYSDLYPREAASCLAGDRYALLMQSLLNRRITLGWTTFEMIRQLDDFYFRTDHHWTMPGAYLVYLELYRDIAAKTPSMGPPLQPREWFQRSGIRFLGSLSRLCLFDRLYDDVTDARFSLPDEKIVVNGNANIPRIEKEAEEQETPRRQLYFPYYAYFFGGDRGLVEYSTAVAGGRKLLVIGDSYDNILEKLLAAHYEKAYFVDLRLYRRENGAEFNLEDFARKKSIDDVIFIGADSWVLDCRKEEE